MRLKDPEQESYVHKKGVEIFNAFLEVGFNSCGVKRLHVQIFGTFMITDMIHSND